MNLTAASQNLYELINTQSIVCYPDSGMRLAVSRAIALETGRGWRIAKEKQAHKIDIVVALAMARYAAVKAQSEPCFDQSWSWVSGPPDKADPHNLDAWRALRTSLYYQTGGAYRVMVNSATPTLWPGFAPTFRSSRHGEYRVVKNRLTRCCNGQRCGSRQSCSSRNSKRGGIVRLLSRGR